LLPTKGAKPSDAVTQHASSSRLIPSSLSQSRCGAVLLLLQPYFPQTRICLSAAIVRINAFCTSLQLSPAFFCAYDSKHKLTINVSTFLLRSLNTQRVLQYSAAPSHNCRRESPCHIALSPRTESIFSRWVLESGTAPSLLQLVDT
jgi:hypothetical protein